MTIFVASLGFGVVTAAILALAALGFTLQAGMTNVVNLAYGDYMTVGAFATLIGQTSLHFPLWPATAFGALVVGVLSWLINRTILGPFIRRGTRSFQMLVVTFSIGIILEYLIVAKWGEIFYAYHGLTLSLSGSIQWGSFLLTKVQVIITALAIALLLVFHGLVRYTRFGRSLRAMADDKELARACGVNVTRLTDIVWLISGALAGLAGTALAINAGSFDEILGANFMLVVVAAAILGGAGEAYGAMIGAAIIGFATEVSTVWIPGGDKEAVALVILIVMVLVRPQGIVSGRGKWVLAQ
jgi:branched-chain amino acid transport system permease protein/neutral amino acid transport system permease protein